MQATLLADATLIDGSTSSVLIDGDTIAAVGQALDAPDTAHVVDLSGFVLVPAAVEPHAHLDKAFLAERIENLTGDLYGAIEAMQSNRQLLDVPDIVARAERAARMMAANGYTAVRTHADTTVEHGLRSIEALAEVRRRVADVIDVEIVALCGWPVTGPAGVEARALLVDALAAGGDLVGGCPHLEQYAGSGTIASATDTLLQIAVDHGRDVDLHTDETLDPCADGLDIVARRVLAGFPHRVTASHCVSLGQQSIDQQRATAERVAAAGISVIVLPHTNLFLQGRERVPMPRGLTAVPALREAGVNVAAGADNLQDPFNPVGRACPFETAGLMVMAAHLLPHEAWHTVSAASATALARTHTIAVGNRANLVAARATSVREAIAFGPADRVVWRNGTMLGTRSGSPSE